MKKLFAFFVMAMVITTMAFGQMENVLYPVVQPVQDPQDDRTSWIGGMEEYDYYLELSEGKKICMRLPASGALPAGNNLSVTKVAFRWQTTNGNEDDPVYFDPNFRVLIYAGCNSDWIQDGQNVYRTMDTTVQGNLLYSQNFTCDGTGWQMVELNRPVYVPSDQEIWIAVQALGHSCCLVCPDYNKQHPEWWGQHLIFGYRSPANPTPENPAGWYWSTAGFIGNNETTVPGKFALRVLIDNGEAYVTTTDWGVDMYSLETAEAQTNITRLYVDEFMMMDSLYLVPAFWNYGPDVNVADGRARMYIEGTDIVLFNETFSDLVPYVENIETDHGWVVNWLGGLLAYSDMERLGLTFPFVVCCSFESYGYDPNLSNNQACVLVTDQEEEDPGDDPGVLVSSNDLNTLNISPNPANTYIKVENAAGSMITVYNVAGQEVLSVTSAEANETLDISELNAGLYIVRVANGNEVTTAKVSIVR